MHKPDWREVYADTYQRIRVQMEQERASHLQPRRGMKDYSDEAIDQWARREATRRIEEAINRWNEEQDIKARKGLL